MTHIKRIDEMSNTAIHTLICLFDRYKFDSDEIEEMKEIQNEYTVAKDGIGKGICDIYTTEDFFVDLNKNPEKMKDWYALPVQVDNTEYNKWWK